MARLSSRGREESGGRAVLHRIAMRSLEKYGLQRVIYAIGMPAITGAHVVAEELIREAAEILRINVEIDEL